MFRNTFQATAVLASLIAPLGSAALAEVWSFKSLPPNLLYVPDQNPDVVCVMQPCPGQNHGMPPGWHTDHRSMQKLESLQLELLRLRDEVRDLARRIDDQAAKEAEVQTPEPGVQLPEVTRPAGKVECSLDLVGEEGAQVLHARAVAGPLGWNGRYDLSVLTDGDGSVALESEDALTLAANETRVLGTIVLAGTPSVSASLTLAGPKDDAVVCHRTETLGGGTVSLMPTGVTTL